MQTRVVLQNKALIDSLQPNHAILKTFGSRKNWDETHTTKNIYILGIQYIARVWTAMYLESWTLNLGSKQ